ncbi:MAG TPA: DMT family transporter [Anaerolineae bacterium]|nr:DMT family transporter [Anaerolineae bacterium]HID85185.1 DMT family transporter [Anaerolineales bacterium]
MSSLFLGELAALGAAVCFTFGPTMFTLAGRRVGSLTVNRFRLLLASLFLLLLHFVFYGQPYPALDGRIWGYLFLSGVIGLAISDVFLFEAFVRIGPRLALLVLNLVPVATTAVAWVLFGEHLTGGELAAIAVTLAGVSWVVAERPLNDDGTIRAHDPRGLLFAFAAVGLQTVSTLLAKGGMMAGIPAVSGNVVRMSGGVLALWLWTLLKGEAGSTLRVAWERPRVLGIIAAGVAIGPVLGITLSLFALKVIPVGIVSTLGSLTPVLLIPVSRWVFHERVSLRAVWGTLLATAGVAWLLLMG